METEEKAEELKERPKLTSKQKYKIMSRYLVKKQRPILPQTYINTRGLSRAQLQPTAPPAVEKPIISDSVKARLQSDLNALLLLNQHTIERRIQPAESFISLPISRTLSMNQHGSEDKDDGKLNTHNSDLAPSLKSGHGIDEQRKLTTKTQRPTEPKLSPKKQSKGDIVQAKNQKLSPKAKNDKIEAAKQKLVTKARQSIVKGETHQSTLPPTKQKNQDHSKIRHLDLPPKSKNDKSEAVEPKLATKPSSKKETAYRSSDHDCLASVLYSSSDSKNSQPAKLSSSQKHASRDKAHTSKARNDKSFGLTPSSIGHIEFSQRPQKPKRVRRHSSSSFDDSIFEVIPTDMFDLETAAPSTNKQTKKNDTSNKFDKNDKYSFVDLSQLSHKSHSHRHSASPFNDDISIDFDTIDNDIRAGEGSVAPSMSWNSSKFSADRKEWQFDEPKYTEPSSVSSSRFGYRSQGHFGPRILNYRETETETIESGSSGKRHTRVIKKQVSRPGRSSPFMEQILIQKMKHPY